MAPQGVAGSSVTEAAPWLATNRSALLKARPPGLLKWYPGPKMTLANAPSRSPAR